jgi:hypothetical protein
MNNMTWLILIITLIFQELATTGAALLAANTQHFNIWIIHVIWLIATLADIVLGFFLGKWTEKNFQNARIVRWAKRLAARIEHATGTTGIKISLALLGIVNYPYLNAFIASWLPNIKPRDVILATLVGDLIWYAFAWATVLGIASAGRNYELIFTIIAIAGIAGVIVGNFIKKKIIGS